MNGVAVQRVREALDEHGCQPRGGLKIRARCLVHESRGPTLAVSQGRAGAVVKCFAGCETTDILAALGLHWDDLYDEPRETPLRQWKAPPRPPTPAEQAGRVIVRAVRIMLTAEAMKATAVLRPRLTAEECVEHAEWACRRDADAHYWQTMARYAALACDEAYVRQAHADRAWDLAHPRERARTVHEQHVVLMTRAEDLERAR